MNDFLDLFTKVAKDTGKGVKGFLKAQLIIMLITFVILSIGLSVINVPLPVLIAMGIAVFDLIPVVGSGIIMIPWALISIAGGNTETGKQLAILYVFLVVLRQIIEPKVIGDHIGINPIVTFISSILGSIVFGPAGFIIGPVIAIVINSIKKNRASTK
ncbi:MAG: AI-2E family transporter [Eubacteriaceae bacterium]|nr:AI-2E family transporter [Eubacteriaceae bacterium]